MQIVPAILRNSVEEFGESLEAFRALSSLIHVDVLDGSLVPGQTLLPTNIPVASGVSYSWHLMVSDPTQYLRACLARPTAEVIVHAEIGVDRLRATIHELTNRGVGVGLALNPETPITMIEPFLTSVQSVLVLTVEPGAQGSTFLAKPLAKLVTLRELVTRARLSVDGSVNPQTVPELVRYRPDMLVVGSYLWPGPDLAQRWSTLQRAVR